MLLKLSKKLVEHIIIIKTRKIFFKFEILNSKKGTTRGKIINLIEYILIANSLNIETENKTIIIRQIKSLLNGL